MAPQKKKVKVVKKTRKELRSRVHKTINEGRQRMAERRAKMEELKKRMEAASEEEAKAMKMEIDTLDDEIEKDEKEVKDAEVEEAKFKKDEEDAEKMDEMEVDDENDPDKPRASIETETETGTDTTDIVEKLKKGLDLDDPYFDLSLDSQLRNTQLVLCYKDGFGKPAIVADYQFPKSLIYRIRNDLSIPESTPNFMKWRRAGKVNPRTGKKWSVEDMVPVLPRIAIKVPPGYEGNPEDLAQLIPVISGADRDALKEAGKPIPKQPEVQLYIKWKEGFIAEGETEERFTSWESRSGCRTLWKKRKTADNLLVTVATKREQAYRNAGGKNSSEPRSMSPFDFPRAASSPDRESETPGREYSETPGREYSETPEREEEEDKKKKEAEEEKKKKQKENEGKGGFNASDYKAASDNFALKFCARKGWDANKLNDTEEADLMLAFDYVWAKIQAEERVKAMI